MPACPLFPRGSVRLALGLGLSVAGLLYALSRSAASLRAASPASATASAPASSTAPVDPTVRLITCETVAEGYDKLWARFPAARGPAEARWKSAGQLMVLQLDAPDHPMLVEPSATVTARRDNSGAALSTVLDSRARSFYPLEANLSYDHRHAFIHLLFLDPPPRGATSVTVEGAVELRCAAQRTTHLLKNIPFRTGATFTAGGTGFTVDSVTVDKYRTTRFALTSTESFENVLSIQLLSLETNKPFTGYDFFDSHDSGKSLLQGSVAQPPAAMNVQVEIAHGEEAVTIPFKFELAVGDPAGPMALATTGPAAPPTTAPSTAAAPQVKVMPLAFRRDLPLDENLAREWFGWRGNFEGYRRPPTKLWLHVVANQPILQSSAAAFTASSFTDDRGTLLHGSGTAPVIKGLSRNGHETTLGIFSSDLPALDAKFLIFHGALTLKLAGPPITTVLKDISMAAGTKFKIADRACKIEVTNFVPYNTAMNMYVSIPGSLDAISNLTFLDGDGKLLANIYPVDQYRAPVEGKPSYLSIPFPRVLDTATIRAVTLPDGDTITVPIDVKVPLGL